MDERERLATAISDADGNLPFGYCEWLADGILRAGVSPSTGEDRLAALEHDLRSVMATAEEARDRDDDDSRLYYVGMVYAYQHALQRIGWLAALTPTGDTPKEPT